MSQKAVSRGPFSRFTTFLVVLLLFIVLMAFVTAFPRPYSMDPASIETFVNQTLAQWRAEYAASPGMKVGRIDIHFDARPDCFVSQEGAVIAPVGIELKKKQKILEIAAYPPILRELRVDGIRCLAWPYPGKCRDSFNYVALSLVQQESSGSLSSPQSATWETLSSSFAADALAKVEELEEHNLEECAVFIDWAHALAGKGPYPDQFQQIVKKIAEGIVPRNNKKKWKGIDDICAAIRHNCFHEHWAHVLSVMACRENGIPCFGFLGATPERNHLIGMYSDQTGWVFFDFDHPNRGFFTDPPVLLTQAPLFTEFDASMHDFWNPSAAAYKKSEFWGVASALSYTVWGKQKKERTPDRTRTRTFVFDGLEQWRK